MNPRSSSSATYFTQGAFAPTSCTFDPVTFAPSPDCGTFGTANRRFLHGPGMNNTDFGIQKDFRITEARSFEFRAEFFNIFNHAQFNNPTGDISSGNFGNVTSARAMRIGQLSGKFIW
jgi:hypothetical protein